jgi:hypothetical protein
VQRFLSYFRSAQLDRDLEAEMVSHIEFATQENLQRGMSPAEAARRARIRFGGTQQARENQREARSFSLMDELLQDLRFTLRTLRKDRSFTIIALVILALSIGANTAVFSVVNTLLLRPLPFPDSHELVWIAPPPTSCGLMKSSETRASPTRASQGGKHFPLPTTFVCPVAANPCRPPALMSSATFSRFSAFSRLWVASSQRMRLAAVLIPWLCWRTPTGGVNSMRIPTSWVKASSLAELW